jgi:hypothetical protein
MMQLGPVKQTLVNVNIAATDSLWTVFYFFFLNYLAAA